MDQLAESTPVDPEGGHPFLRTEHPKMTCIELHKSMNCIELHKSKALKNIAKTYGKRTPKARERIEIAAPGGNRLAKLHNDDKTFLRSHQREPNEGCIKNIREKQQGFGLD
jgi:hypothetical protein